MQNNLRPIHGNINLNELRLLGLKKESILDIVKALKLVMTEGTGQDYKEEYCR